jgi:endoglucanase
MVTPGRMPGISREQSLTYSMNSAHDRVRRSNITAWLTRRNLWLAAACAAVFSLSSSPALAGTANAGLSGASPASPIADMTWGYYTGSDDEIYPTYQAATGADQQLLAEVALRPEANWFGSWEKPAQIREIMAGYISDVIHGNPSVLAQLSDFALSPWEGALCNSPETPALVSAYHQWNDGFAAGIGNARALVVMQPDLPEVNNTCLSAATRATYLQEVAWATQKLDALKRTTVYLDAGSSDWQSVRKVTTLLIQSGIRWARGFSLDATHHASTQSEIAYGAQLARALARRGYPDKHFIVDTAENGSPFTNQQYKAAGGPQGNVPACQTLGQAQPCQTFGIPPTWQVGLSEWQLGGHYDALADKYADGYVWFGRPWLYGQSSQFDCQLVEQMAQSTPFPYPDGVSTGQQAANPMLRFDESGASAAIAHSISLLPANPYCPASSLG